ncbi:hypothetical protein TRFO_17369 [Tritrichomonas foetus]|uniref:Protein kinase domain-containing protein n=1 Tax=Tritrichomonas foetus TaxID=1144522 RepID=A0A1J4KNM9_9EUKA|nr:hypothetical protein TRFO_17369 [Tritrichomonas foetus]|eukprot:OHT12738.1 hypothetical protein TRFO_17369 [Tritrichomonas foetus]
MDPEELPYSDVIRITSKQFITTEDRISYWIVFDKKKRDFFFESDFDPSSASTLLEQLKSTQSLKNWEKNFLMEFLGTKLSFLIFNFFPGNSLYSNLYGKEYLLKYNDQQIMQIKYKWCFSIAFSLFVFQTNEMKYKHLSPKSILIDDSNDCAKLINTYSSDEKLLNFTHFYEGFIYSAPEVHKSDCFTDYKCDYNKANVFSYGLILNEIYTEKSRYEPFKNKNKNEIIDDIKLGKIYQEMDQNHPFYDIFDKCTQLDPSKRCSIKDVIKSLLDEGHLKKSKIDIENFKSFLEEILILKKASNYEELKEIILYNILEGNDPVDKHETKTNPKSSFYELKTAFSNNSNYKKVILDFVKKRDSNNSYSNLIQYAGNNHIFDIFECLLQSKPFIVGNIMSVKNMADYPHRNSFNNHLLIQYSKGCQTSFWFLLPFEVSNSLIKFSQLLVGDEKRLFVEFPENNLICFYPGLNVYKHLYDNASSLNIYKTDKIYQWLFTAAAAFHVIHSKGYCFLNFSSKTIFLDEKLNGRLFMTNIFQLERKKIIDNLNPLSAIRIVRTFTDEFYDYYKAPELLKRVNNPIDYQKCDVYSFGIFMHELLDGFKPGFNNSNLSKNEKFNHLINPSFHDIESKNDDLHQLMRKCLSKIPKDRPCSSEIYEFFYKNFQNHYLNDATMTLCNIDALVQAEKNGIYIIHAIKQKIEGYLSPSQQRIYQITKRENEKMQNIFQYLESNHISTNQNKNSNSSNHSQTNSKWNYKPNDSNKLSAKGKNRQVKANKFNNKEILSNVSFSNYADDRVKMFDIFQNKNEIEIEKNLIIGYMSDINLIQSIQNYINTLIEPKKYRVSFQIDNKSSIEKLSKYQVKLILDELKKQGIVEEISENSRGDCCVIVDKSKLNA